jgi:hypothetical protein
MKLRKRDLNSASGRQRANIIDLEPCTLLSEFKSGSYYVLRRKEGRSSIGNRSQIRVFWFSVKWKADALR